MNYVFITAYKWLDDDLYADLRKLDNVQFYQVGKPFRSPIKRFLYRVNRSHKVNKIIHLPLFRNWHEKLFRMVKEDTCLIFTTGALSLLEEETMRNLYNLKRGGILI